MERSELARLLGAPPGVAEARPGPIVVEESEPARFMTACAAAVGGSGPVFIADPTWGAAERLRLSAMVQLPDAPSARARGWLCIPSGGTSGELKWARHDEGTIAAAVGGFCSFFSTSRVNAIGVLPLNHVSGLMAWMRCAFGGGEYRPASWGEIAAGRFPAIRGQEWFISLVPTQLQRLLEVPAGAEWLRGFRAVFVGGGPVWAELAERAAQAKIPVSLTYGMTETAAMVAAQQPGDFLAGTRTCGSALPHARITLAGDGGVLVEGESVFRGYWPEFREERRFATADLGSLDSRGHLHILGRGDAAIITGGKKVQPEEVEAALKAAGGYSDVAVIGVPDPEWGEIVVACYPGDGLAPDAARASALVAHLASYKRPKRFLALSDWPRNAQGKLNRAKIASMIPRT